MQREGFSFSCIALLFLAGAIAEDGVVPDGEAVFADTVAGVAFDGVDAAVFDLFDDADVVGVAVLAAGGGFDPVEEDDVSGVWDVGSIAPLSVGFEPADTNRAACEGRDAAVLNVATFVGTPADEAGAPFHAALVAHEAPIWLAADVAELGHGDEHDRSVPNKMKNR